MLKLLAFTLPLCLDTFAVSCAGLGGLHLSRTQRIRGITLLIAFEAGMPLVGMAIAAPLMHLVSTPTHLVFDPYPVGSPAEARQLRLAYGSHLADTTDLTFVGRYILPIVVPVVVGGLGLLMLAESLNDDDDDDDDGDDEIRKAKALVGARGWTIIGLGLGISLDELVVGFTLGFTTLPAADVIIAIVIQAFLAIMLGQYLGRKARAGELRVSAERLTSGSKLLAGSVLVGLSAVLLIGPPVATHLLPHFIHHPPPRSSAPQAVSTNDP
jgi:manganese efflux pump family protein